MNTPIIIGIGNEFRGDDAVGIIIARKLKKDFPTLEIIEFQQTELDLIDYFKRFKSVVLIDAISSTESKKGTIEKFIIDQDFEFSRLNYFSSHSISLGEILGIAKIMNSLPNKLVIIGINASNFQMGTQISFDIEATYLLVKEEIKNIFKLL